MTRSVRRPLAVALVVAGVAVGWVALRAAAIPPPSVAPYPDDTYIGEVGIRLAAPLPGDTAKTSRDDAVRNAADDAGDLADLAKPYSVQLIRLTDENYGPAGEPLVIESRLVWLVRFTGTPQPVFGGMTRDNSKPYPNPAMELNVVVDAASGQVLESFSFQ